MVAEETPVIVPPRLSITPTDRSSRKHFFSRINGTWKEKKTVPITTNAQKKKNRNLTHLSAALIRYENITGSARPRRRSFLCPLDHQPRASVSNASRNITNLWPGRGLSFSAPRCLASSTSHATMAQPSSALNDPAANYPRRGATVASSRRAILRARIETLARGGNEDEIVYIGGGGREREQRRRISYAATARKMVARRKLLALYVAAFGELGEAYFMGVRRAA